MDQSALVRDRIHDGYRLVERFAADGHVVRAAFWGKPVEEDWFLYVVTDEYETGGPAVVYHDLYAASQKLGKALPTKPEVKAIGPNHPIAKDILSAASRLTESPTWLGEKRLGAVNFDQVYLYPLNLFTLPQVTPMTTEEIGQEILRLMNRGANVLLQPSHISLKDGTAFSGVPISLRVLSPKRSLVAQFVAEGEPFPRDVELEEIASVA